MTPNELTVESLLRAHAPHAPDSLRMRVLALEPKERQARVPSRRLALVVVCAAVGVAVSAALVHGIVGSGSSTQTAVERQLAPAAAGPAPLDAATGHAAAKSVAPNVAAGARVQHTAASIELRVGNDDELSRATTQATRIATSLGGYAKSVHYSSSGSSVIDLRVPAAHVKQALVRLAGLGTVVSQQLSVTDLEQQVERQAAQIGQLHRRIAALQRAIADPSLAEGQKVLLRIKLAEAKRALAQRLHAQKSTVAAGATSTISLTIATKKAVVPATHHRGRLGRMVHSAVGFLALEAILLLCALIVVSPFALVAWLVWLWRRRSVDRLLTT
jgi:hypothetical protein